MHDPTDVKATIETGRAFEAAHRLDSWISAVTGLGGLRDKRASYEFQRTTVLTDIQLENLYDDDDMAARIVEARPEEALRQGFSLRRSSDSSDSEGPDPKETKAQAAKLEAKLQELGARGKVLDAAVWGNLYGGGALLVGADDNGPLHEPLDEEMVDEVRFLTVLEKRDLQPLTWYDDPRDPKFGQPSLWLLTPSSFTRSGASLPKVVHESRLILFGGVRTSLRRKKSRGGWDNSVLQRVHEVLQGFNASWAAIENMLQDASQGVFKLHGLISMIAAGKKAELQTRMELNDMARSVARSLLLDAEKEEFEYNERTFAGIHEILDKLMLRLAAAARMPVSILFGRAPAGLNATGESDIRGWYDQVKAYQEHTLKPRLERLVRMVARSLGFAEPESWGVVFPSIWQESPNEQAERRGKLADTDVQLVEAGILHEDEVAMHRFGEGGWDTEIVIDWDEREKEAEEEEEEEAELEVTPPFPFPPKEEGTEPDKNNGGGLPADTSLAP